MSDKKEVKEEKSLGFENLISNSDKFQQLQKECAVAVKLSLTGITNLVVNYEDPCLVDCFLKSCFRSSDLYNETYETDAIELQRGRPGQGFGAQYLDTLIFGSYEEEADKSGLGAAEPKLDPQTGKRQRNPDGFVNRKDVLTGEFKDRLLVIKNVDYSMDFCQAKPGQVDARSLWIFDNFRNPSIKKGCRLLLVTNKRLVLPFKIRTVEIDPVDEYEADHIITSFIQLYEKNKYDVALTESQRKQMVRKLCGLTYTEAGDALGEALSSNAETKKGSKIIDSGKTVKNLREKINRNFMQDANGLTHICPKPWEDYICPESSNFTYDVKKILRDFTEIDKLKIERDALVAQNKDESLVLTNMDSIRTRMPHVIVLYGKGGVGKSAFPVHFAGLLDFDCWDFNVNATHSKWVGEGSERMRDALGKITKSSHVVIRIDEYDRAMGSTSGSGSGMHESHKQVESEFMNWLQNTQEDNILVKNDIFIILTTNHKENITGPLLRSGRADLVIDIADFDAESMKEAFVTAHRRMMSRGVAVTGFANPERLSEAVNKLDLDRLASIATTKGFTVRDVDMLLVEMAAHDYYHRKYNDGIPWTTDNFVQVLENSTGSTKDENTSELTLGDRYLLEEKTEKEDQTTFGFFEDCSTEFSVEDFTDVSFFKE